MSEFLIAHDLRRAVAQSAFPERHPRERNLRLEPSFTETLEFIRYCSTLESCAVDIETDITVKEMTHLSLAYSADEAICIPLSDGAKDYWSPDQELEIMEAIQSLLENPAVRKVGQNITFDATFLFTRFGIVTRPVDDTMVAQAFLMPDYPKGLDFITAMYCAGEPYYKDDGKAWRAGSLVSSELSFRRYSAMDSAVVMEAFPQQRRDLERQNNWDAYRRQVALIEPLVYIATTGVQMIPEKLVQGSEATGARCQELLDILRKDAGPEFNPDSPKQVADFFYITLGNRAYYGKSGSPTTDDKALKRLASKGVTQADILLEYRHLAKMKGTYYDITLDPDNRLRCSWNPVGTKQSRVSSSKTIFGTGGNMQNQPPEMSSAMIADPGNIFIEHDLAQAENRVVAYISRDIRMKEAFAQGIDLHRLTASLIYGVPIEMVTLEQRQWGKRANHGLNYDLGPGQFAIYYQITQPEAKFIVERYHETYPGVREWHRSIRDQLAKSRTLVNLLGRAYQFRTPWSVDLFKQAYSYVPQSTVAGVLNEWGMVYLYQHQDLFPEVSLVNNVHDSVKYQVPLSVGPSRILEIIRLIATNLSQPLFHQGESFIIPTDTAIGFTMDKPTMLEWKAKKVSTTPDAALVEELESYVKGSAGLG